MAINPKRRAAIHAKTAGRCGYCGRPITLDDMQIDHMMPQSMPSLSTFLIDGKKVNRTHHESNLMPACAICNHYKGTATVEGFRQMLKKLHVKIANHYIIKVARVFGIVKIEPFDGVFYFEKKR